jgi:hypothetical protein
MMIRLDTFEYMVYYTVSKLIGLPPAMVLVGNEGGQLTAARPCQQGCLMRLGSNSISALLQNLKAF